MTNIPGTEDALVLPDESEKLRLAKEALINTDKDRFPKLYESRKAVVESLEMYENQRNRAKRAEKHLKEPLPAEKETPTKSIGEATPKTESSTDFTPKDYLALSQAGVPADDLDEVVDYAKFKGISIAEALKTSYIKMTLKEREEERKTSQAANTGPTKRGASRVSEDVLMDKLNKGELPEEDIERAAKLRMARRKQGA